MPVGIGYDVHRLVAGRALFLGGVEFSFDRGLLGHSDGDVALHAAMDALLGAASLGDIGQHFPPGDPRYANVRSVELLRRVAQLVADQGWHIGHLDLMIIAEEPRLGPRVPEMRRVISQTIGIAPERISIKATTNEGLGFIGRGEGIAALAVAELIPGDPSNDDRAGTSTGEERRG